MQVIFVEQDVKWTLWTSKLCPPFAPSKSEMYPCFSREMTIHILLNGAFLCWKEEQGPSLSVFHTGYFRLFQSLCRLLYSPPPPSLKRGLSWRRNVFGMSHDYKPIPIYAVVLVCWLWVCCWLANSIGTGWGKEKNKPALCVLGSSTVYFYCTWSINLSIDLCCHYFLILCLSGFFFMHMRWE